MAKIEKYLEKGITITAAIGNKPAQAFKLADELVLSEMAEDVNPVDSEACLSTQGKYGKIYFPAYKLRTRFVLEEGDLQDTNVLNEQLCKITYDVPSTGVSAGYSPCAELYRVAVPTSESAWLVRAGNVPHNLIAKMFDMGCKVDVDLLDLSETKAKVAKAIGYLQQKMVERIELANEAMRRAETAFSEAMEDEENTDKEAIIEKYIKRSKEVEARLKKLSKEVREGSYKFGFANRAYNPDSLLHHAAAIRQTALDRAKAYQAGTALLASVGTPDATAMAVQAEASELPVFALSDAIRESEQEGASEVADKLNEEFGLTGSE